MMTVPKAIETYPEAVILLSVTSIGSIWLSAIVATFWHPFWMPLLLSTIPGYLIYKARKELKS